MAKPWARYEIDYINGPKFLALTSNAHSLWWESKNYCDKHVTDGFFPVSTARTFRFYSLKSVELLTRSCGPKTNGVPWAPLWETLDMGGVPYFKMHDYLDHNDCHDEVHERLSDAEQRHELRRLQAKKRKREERARRAEQIAALKPEPDPSVTVTLGHAPVTQSSVTVTHQTQTESEAPTPTEPVRPSDGGGITRRSGKEPPLSLGLFRFKVWRWMVDHFIQQLGPHAERFDLTGWFQDLDRRETDVILDSWPWLQAEFAAEVTRRGLPIASAALAPTNQRISNLMRGGQKFLERSAR